ncbi:MAG: acetyl-CoA hydrolase/transferase family protein [Desulfobulbaceae bacterium]|nr:MAG: acetyl-CoA hydrolase/transferase family protein [Desulfobulbaceae bacterium]
MGKWQELYQEKLVSAETAAAAIESGDHIWFPVGAGEPDIFLQALIARKKSLRDVVTHQILPAKPGYFDEETAPHIRHESLFISGASRAAVQGGWADLTPNYFSEVPRLIREYWPADAVGVVVAPMDEHGYFGLSLGVDYTWEAMKKAKKIIVEVNQGAPRCHGNCQIHVSKVTHVVECPNPIPELPSAPLTEIDETIGGYVAELIEDGSTLQIGFGGVPNAVCKALMDKKDLGIHTEMVTEGIMELAECGAVNNSKKTWNRGKLIGTFAWGTKRLYAFMHQNPMVEMHPVDYTNNPYNIGKNDKMVAINATIEVDLMGQCCSESMGPKQWSSTGGQVDFFRGANISNGGKGFVTMPSTAKKGSISRIVPMLSHGAVVTTSKNDVDHVVTEYGVAKLRGKSIRERAKALIAIAHPDFRMELQEAAQKMSII